mmetsp:Transcript_27227/g.49814  ORF Transcript_27227/g.49814 Transcript_27227/m.49814 type:complete len:109 (+) Transcript_27227:96-422(+)
MGAPDRVGMCHCLECRKHHGALFYSSAVFPRQNVRTTGTTLGYKGRRFCAQCGASVFAQSGGEVEVHLGTLDMPDQFKPTYELWTIRRESWLAPVPGAAQYERDRDTG